MTEKEIVRPDFSRTADVKQQGVHLSDSLISNSNSRFSTQSISLIIVDSSTCGKRIEKILY